MVWELLPLRRLDKAKPPFSRRFAAPDKETVFLAAGSLLLVAGGLLMAMSGFGSGGGEGVAAIAAKIAVAVSAVAPTAVGEFASGSHVLLWGDGLTAPEVRAFLLEHHPDLWQPLLDLFARLGAHIK